MKGCIYRVENINNGMIYIGKTKNFRRRVQQHFNSALKEKNSSIFYQDIRKYGICSFKAKIIEEFEIENEEEFENEMYNKEMYYINFYNTINKGYNTFESHRVGRKTGTVGKDNIEKMRVKKGINVYDRYGNFIVNYDRLYKLCKDLSINKGSVSNVLARRKKHAKGYIFRWGDEVLDMSEYKDYKFVIKPKRIDYTGLFE